MIFAYGEHEVNPLQDEQKGSYILVRDREEEEQLLRLMYDKHFSVRREQFVLTKEDRDISVDDGRDSRSMSSV